MAQADPERGRALEAQLEALEQMNLERLRAFWTARWGFAPKLRSTTLLRHMIAWRLQSSELGGLDQATKDLLRRNTTLRPPRLPAGSRVTREYRGVLHSVEVAPDGFTYQDRSYASLSEIAREITGVRWNGPRFFGLRPRPGSNG